MVAEHLARPVLPVVNETPDVFPDGWGGLSGALCHYCWAPVLLAAASLRVATFAGSAEEAFAVLYSKEPLRSDETGRCWAAAHAVLGCIFGQDAVLSQEVTEELKEWIEKHVAEVVELCFPPTRSAGRFGGSTPIGGAKAKAKLPPPPPPRSPRTQS